ncbi:Ig domain-containing protein [Streptomyces sp. NPDC004244]|uniref:Ig domain-containing protein n=1 Tax=Streptomyces sp. NPDC101206 TaxID=3366128 RepID=UPI0037FB7AF9
MTASPRARARAPRRLAALALGIGALLAAPVAPAVAAADAAGAARPVAPVAGTVSDEPIVVGSGDRTDYQYDSVREQMIGMGGVPPYTFSAVNLHAGTSINTTTGLISGVVRSTGTRLVTVTIRDSIGQTGTRSFNWRVIRECPRC